MCGICGVALSDPERPVDRDVLHRMTDIVRHRGPDSRGFHLAAGVGLGVQRLAINDLETGDQPIANEDGTVVVVCNGEIYNFVELRDELAAAGHHFRTGSDVEVIVHLYEDLGVDCVHRLRGMFGFALWDARRRRLMLARDRIGIKPLHYALGKDGCYFGSEYKSILIADRIARQLDVRALEDLFSFGFVIGQKTLFTEIWRLLPGHYLLYADGRASVHRYWDLATSATRKDDRSKSTDEWAEALLEKLRESVRLHLRSDVPVGAWLSGGLDSSGIVSLMSRLAPGSVHTFSLAFEDPDFDELSRQRTLDRFPDYRLTPHRAVCGSADFALFPKLIWHTEDPTGFGTGIARLLLSESASRGVKVVLTGEGADELFGGYPWWRGDRLLRPLGALPLPLRRLLSATPLLSRRWPGASRLLRAPREMNRARYRHLTAPLQSTPRGPIFSPDLDDVLGGIDDADGEIQRPADLDSWDGFAQLQYYEMSIRLPDWIIRTVDRASMAHSLEVRLPFLDHELVELCVGMPARVKAAGPQEKYVLRRALRSSLPEEIVRRKKRGLATPQRHWLRGELPDFAIEMLSRDRLSAKGYFDPDGVVGMLEDHRAGRGDYDCYLLGVLGVQLWDDLFMRGCRPS